MNLSRPAAPSTGYLSCCLVPLVTTTTTILVRLMLRNTNAILRGFDIKFFLFFTCFQTDAVVVLVLFTHQTARMHRVQQISLIRCRGLLHLLGLSVGDLEWLT